MVLNDEEVKQKRLIILQSQLVVLENNYLLTKDRLEKQIQQLQEVI